MTQNELAQLLIVIQEIKQRLSQIENCLDLFSLDFKDMKTKLENKNPTEVIKGWIPRHIVMKYLNYGNTQFSAFIRKYNIVTSKFGKRSFVSQVSLLDALEKNKDNN